MFAISIHFHRSLIFVGKARSLPECGHLMGLHSNANLQAFPAHIRLGWMREAVANTVAYYVTATITAVKCFIVQAPAGTNVIKHFFSITVGYPQTLCQAEKACQ